MTIDIVTPTFPESIQEGTIAKWHKRPGEPVARDQVLVDVETDKVVLEVVAPVDGSLAEILLPEQTIVHTGDLLARFVAAAGGAVATVPAASGAVTSGAASAAPVTASPAARKIAAEQGVDLNRVAGTGRDGRITKEDVVGHRPGVPEVPASAPQPAPERSAEPAAYAAETAPARGERIERRVPMTRMRARIAERLLEVTHTTAMLTTFNEVDMHRVTEVRTQYKDEFAKVHNGVRLGFMGFFVKASVEALKRFPQVNASIDGNDVVYHGYQDIGVAVATDRGLVVPVLRSAENLTIAEIESKIADFGTRARDNKLTMEEMTGGTFTITNGGVFGSMLSTPILNPPQVGILGMHATKQRAMVMPDGSIQARPVMYLALSYDHRIIDGREAVSFLVRVKECIEAPERILLDA